MKKVKVLTTAVVAILAAGSLSSCASSNQGGTAQTQPDGKTIVLIEEKPLPGAYMPESVSVKAGSVVVFENKSSLPHNVVFEDPSLKDSPLMKTGESFSVNFKSSGEFSYVCTLHPVMRGSVSVS
jgi:plastocyanin